MLVLSRKEGERIAIGANITVTALEVSGSRVRIGIEAPNGVKILRQELLLRDDNEAPGRERVRSMGQAPSGSLIRDVS